MLFRSVLHGLPSVLFGLVGLCIFVAFHAIASGKPALPLLFVLICLSVIPVIAMLSPVLAGDLPWALTRSIAVAMLAVWLAYAAWPVALPAVAAAPASPATATALTLAILSTAVVLPLMLAYMLLGWADALPVLIGTIMLVMTFDVARGRKQALGMVLGNFGGGLLGIGLYGLFQSTPSLPFLGLLLFLVLLGFGRRIAAGGPLAGVAVVACNGMLIIFGSAIGSNEPLSAWFARVFQFALAGAFAIGMLRLSWYFLVRPAPTPGRPGPPVPAGAPGPGKQP